MPVEENGFMEYLQLQGSEPDLITKSELINAIRESGMKVGERQLSFYVSEGVIPKSVRVGSRAGAYPAIVRDLLEWVLRVRDGGVPIEAIKELLPVWKYLMRARRDRVLDLAELEYVARQHVTSVEASMSVPSVVSEVMHEHEGCPMCHDRDPGLKPIKVVLKNGDEQLLDDRQTTVGFAIARMIEVESGVEPNIERTSRPSWFAGTRITLAHTADPKTDPTTIVLGLKPNDALPESLPGWVSSHGGVRGEVEEVVDN